MTIYRREREGSWGLHDINFCEDTDSNPVVSIRWACCDVDRTLAIVCRTP